MPPSCLFQTKDPVTKMAIKLVLTIACLGVASASLIDLLKTVHQNPAFNTLPHKTQVLIIELISETEAGELKSYIDLVGFQNVISVLDRKHFHSIVHISSY